MPLHHNLGSDHECHFRPRLTADPNTRLSLHVKSRLLPYYSHVAAMFRCCAISAIRVGLTANNETPSSARPRRASSGSSHKQYQTSVLPLGGMRPGKHSTDLCIMDLTCSCFFSASSKSPFELRTGVDQMSWQSYPDSFRELNHHLAQPSQTRPCTRPYAPVLDDLLTRPTSNTKPICSPSLP